VYAGARSCARLAPVMQHQKKVEGEAGECPKHLHVSLEARQGMGYNSKTYEALYTVRAPPGGPRHMPSHASDSNALRAGV
jgi:hypothetical protein